MHEHELGSVSPLEDLVVLAEGGERIELLRGGTTVAVIIGVEEFDDLVAGLEVVR